MKTLILVLLVSSSALAQPLSDQASAAAPAAASAASPGQEGPTDADETPIETFPEYPRARRRVDSRDPWSPEISPLSFFIGYGLRLDRDHHAQSGTSLGAEYRLMPRLSAQFQSLFGFRSRDNWDDGNDWHHKGDLWALFNLGLKWNPLLFTLIRHPADVFFTAGGLTSTSTGGAFTQGTDYFLGLGGTYYFEPAVKGVIDVRGTPGRHRQYGQVTVGINFQF